MVNVMKVGSSTYTALAGMQKGLDNKRKHTADLASATQMQGHVEASKSVLEIKSENTQRQTNVKTATALDTTLGSNIDVKV